MPPNQSLYSLCIDTWTCGPFFCIDLHSCCLPGASAPEQAGGRYLGRGHTYKQSSTPLINTFVGLIFAFITALYYWSLLSETFFYSILLCAGLISILILRNWFTGNIWYYSSQIYYTQGLNFSGLSSSEDYHYSAHGLTKSNFMPPKKTFCWGY